MSRLFQRAPRLCAVALTCLWLLAACTSSASPPQEQAPTVGATPTSAPTSTPAPTEPAVLAGDVRVAGVDVSGLTPGEAMAAIEAELAAVMRPIELHAGDTERIVRPEEIGLQVPVESLIEEALAAGPGARVALQVVYDEERLRGVLAELADEVQQLPSVQVISNTAAFSRSFVIEPGLQLNIDSAAQQIHERLAAPGSPRRITLDLAPLTDDAPRPAPALLQEQIEALAEEWDGIVGVYVYDIDNDTVVAALNENTVFSGASVMKTAIMLWSYINLPEFTADQETWLEEMIVESDNLSANAMLSASVGGGGTEEALASTLAMSEWLAEMGLEHTYQNMPYEAHDYLVDVRGIEIKRGPPQEGPPPHTDADPVLRTTPAEISQVFLWIDACSRGEGILLEQYGDTLTAARCQEMLDWLERNEDDTRIRAGLPRGVRVEHKSGWIEDMQADVGIVRSPAGDFLMAIYVYQEIDPQSTYLTDDVAAPAIAQFAHVIYSYFNPAIAGE